MANSLPEAIDALEIDMEELLGNIGIEMRDADDNEDEFDPEPLDDEEEEDSVEDAKRANNQMANRGTDELSRCQNSKASF